MATAKMEFKNVVTNVIKEFFPSVVEINREQFKALEALFVDRRDTFAILPTGFGKSLIFQAAPLIAKELGLVEKPLIIVISPLLAIMNLQCADDNRRGVKACCLHDEEVDIESVLACEYQIIYGTPETWLGNNWYSLFQDKGFQKNIILLVADEAHCVPKWGQVQSQKSKVTGRRFSEVKHAFRVSFSKLGIIRTHVPNAPMLALTATADKQTEKSIVKSLCMKRCLMLRVSPNRLNIGLFVFKRKKLVVGELQWIVDGLKKEREQFPKSIVYCKSIEDVAKVFTHIKEELGDISLYSSPCQSSSKSPLIGMYHRKTPDKHKNNILDDMSKGDGLCRVVVATTSLVMGVDINDIRYIIHYGSPLDIEDYIQGVGRAGRDRSSSCAVLYCTGQQLGKASVQMKEYAALKDGCYREALYGPFDRACQVARPHPQHKCCSYCLSICKCDGEAGCSFPKPPFMLADVAHLSPVRSVDEEQKDLLASLLNEYKLKIEHCKESKHLVTHPKFLTSLTEDGIADVIEQSALISSASDVLQHTSVISKIDAGEVVLIFKDVFDDISKENEEEALKLVELTEREGDDIDEWLACAMDESIDIFDDEGSLNANLSLDISLPLDETLSDIEPLDFSD